MPPQAPPTPPAAAADPNAPGAAADAPSPNGHTPLDLQRSALRDLVALATESATTESEIERAYHAGVEQGQKDYERATWTIRQRFEGTKEAVRVKHRDALEVIDARFREDSAA